MGYSEYHTVMEFRYGNMETRGPSKDTGRRRDWYRIANCNVSVKKENGPSLDFPKTVTVDVELALIGLLLYHFFEKYVIFLIFNANLRLKIALSSRFRGLNIF